MEDKKEQKTDDVLSQVKKIEKFKKLQLLAEAIEEIKVKAKEVLELKEETTVLLEEIGLSEGDIKRIIDYVNSLVKLSDADRKEIRERVRKSKEEKEEKISEKLEKYPFIPQSYSMSLSTLPSSSVTDFNTWSVNLGDTGYSIKV